MATSTTMSKSHRDFLQFVAKHTISDTSLRRRRPRPQNSRRGPSCLHDEPLFLQSHSSSTPCRINSEIADRNRSNINNPAPKGKGFQRNRLTRLKDDTLEACCEREKLRKDQQNIRSSLKCIRQQTFSECAKMLNAVMTYCDYKTSGKAIPPIADICGSRPFPDETRGPGAAMSTCLCGGYTPGGANRLRTLQAKSKCCNNPDCPQCSEEKPIRFGAGASSAEAAGAAGEQDCPNLDNLPEESRPSVRILGEMSFQLERRILDYVFGMGMSKRRRFYGYTVSNICYMMEKESTSPGGGNDVIGRTEMTCRLRKMLCALEKYGYDIKVHADFAQQMVNKYGLLPTQPDEATVQLFGLNDTGAMSCLISRLCKRQSEVHNLNILLNCLAFLSKCDGRPLFVW